MKKMTRILALVATTTLGVTLAGCSGDEAPEPEGMDVLERLELADAEGKPLVDELEAVSLDDRRDDLIASVREDHLAVIEAATEEEAALPLPEDEFYLSIAPYVQQTHPCGYHSLTTCVGELPNTDFDVLIVDDEGETILDETVTSEDNGFFGLWLPRDIEGEVTIEYDGLSVTGPFTTTGEAKTCETDLQLT